MKLNRYLKKSLARQFSFLTITIIVAFSLLVLILIFYENQIIDEFEDMNQKLEQKENLSTELNYAFNLAISEMRAYIAYEGRRTYYQNVKAQQKIVADKLSDLRKIAENDKDHSFIKQTQEFYNYYFFNVLPRAKTLYDLGQYKAVTEIAVKQNASKNIRTYQKILKEYTNSLNQQHNEIQERQNNEIFISQLIFANILIFLISGMALLTSKMLSQMGRPLKKLTIAASEIAEGNLILFTDKTKRQDELGLLSMAFEKMTKSIHEKEQDLNAQNEELLAQQEMLQAQYKLTQNILDTIKEGIQLVDVTGNVIQLNQKMCDILECDSTKLLNEKYENWVERLGSFVENGQALKIFFDHTLLTGNGDQTAFTYHQKHPVQKVVQVYCEPLTRDGVKIGTVIVHRDITKEYEVDVMKSELVSTVSHELRTPLASVLGFTELMLKKELNPDRQKKYLSTIYHEAQRLTSLINDFLDIQRMEAGRQTYNKKYENLTPILKNIIETYEINHPSHVISFEIQTTNTIVLCDIDKISQVFTNLIGNAIKYSPNGGRIDVTVFEDGEHLKISIKDEGLGIPEESLDKLFTKFYRVDNSDRRKIGGTGLGLAISQEIMKEHNGEISVQSKLKAGSTFTVIFPLVQK